MIMTDEENYGLVCSPCLWILSPYLWKDFFEMVHRYTPEDYDEDVLDLEEALRRARDREHRQDGSPD